MAAAIMANAFLFHDALAGGPGKLAAVVSLEEMRSKGLTKTAVLAEWRKILHVNYWPIFDIARRILEQIPTAHSKGLVALLADTATKMLEDQLMRSHDLTGAVFQRLIADRKFLAAYYTTPASAALLSGLAISKLAQPNGASWGDVAALKSLRIIAKSLNADTFLGVRAEPHVLVVRLGRAAHSWSTRMSSKRSRETFWNWTRSSPAGANGDLSGLTPRSLSLPVIRWTN
jgi:hypothetical protein